MGQSKGHATVRFALLVSILNLHAMAVDIEACSSLTVERLLCEYLENPLGVDTATPRLGWQLVGDRTGALQTAYQVQAACAPDEIQRRS